MNKNKIKIGPLQYITDVARMPKVALMHNIKNSNMAKVFSHIQIQSVLSKQD